MRHSFIIAPFVLLAGLACAPGSSPERVSSPGAPVAVPLEPAVQKAFGEQVAAAFADAWNRHDMNALAALMAEDADFVNIFGTWMHGREEIRQRHVQIHETAFRNSTITATQVQTRFVAPNVAIVRWAWQVTSVLTRDGQPAPDLQGILTHVVHRQGDRFMLLSTQNTRTVPEPF
ncbi:MAG TPA: SgcJ/EcaC family oxidoreductase [Kofleriaceae bacterium]|nr:SgcJ/EcaC family oxidoreductase [Kofleriaceae bacterium]